MRHGFPRSSTRLPAAALAALSWLATATAADGPPPSPTLHLADGGTVAGAFEASEKAGTIRWRSPTFAGPLAFPIEAVASITFPTAGPARPAGESCFELAGGDVVFGRLAGLDADTATIETTRLGRLKVARSKLVRISRWDDGAGALYLGPTGLAGWHVPPRPAPSRPPRVVRQLGVVRRAQAVEPAEAAPAPGIEAWRDEAGQLATDAAGAALAGDFELPPRAAVEFELSWAKRPDFALALGADDGPERPPLGFATTPAPARDGPFRFEVWDGELVAYREGKHEADLAPIRRVGDGPGRVQLKAYLDLPAGRMIVADPSGKALAELSLPGASPDHPRVRLENLGGDVRLEWLRVGRWDGEAPRDGEARARLADGSKVPGDVLRYDEKAREYVLRGEGGKESRVPADKVAGVAISPPADEPTRGVRAGFADGSRISGELRKVDGEAMTIDVPGVSGPVRVPLAALRTLASPRAASEAAPAWVPRLEAEGVRLRGTLAPAAPDGDAGPLAWRPAGSPAAVPIRRGASARVVLRDPPPKPKPDPQAALRARQVQPGLGLRIINALAGAPGTAGNPAPADERPLALYLRTGDVIPAEIRAIDEQGVTFATPLSAGTFVPHEKVKAVEVARDEPERIRLSKSKRERLLTLPRMQKGSPPTHLVRSRNGDYLRGRVVGLDAKALRVEVHLETKEVPRDRVGRIIWFHADELDEAKPAAAPEPAGAARVQAIRRDGTRLTFAAEGLTDGVVSGKSDVLGACRVALDEVDQLLVGPEIERAASGVAYGPWRLHGAPEPTIPEGDSGSGSGTASPLVGKAAPDFTLDLLDGAKFRLADAKGQVVLLDFWATWCGPCVQAMPQVEAVSEEFKDRGVRLVAVNLQEDPKAIRAMLERHKLRPTVALDVDGAVAMKYEANAIPQTVIIDKDGKVARLFVGGGPDLGDRLREALKAVLDEEGE